MKRLLIFSMSTGGGHNQAATSLEQEFQSHGYDVMKLDALKETNKILDSLITDGYRVLATSFPKTYGEVYKLSDKKRVNTKVTGIITRLIQDKIHQLIQMNKPDLVIATHPFIVNIVGGLKEKEEINIPFISIVTDFDIHQTYINSYVDAYITGSYYTKHSMMNRGILSEKIFTYGIPVSKEFFNESNKEKKDDKIFTILLMGGSMGVRAMEKVLKSLVGSRYKLRIITICGNDKKLKDKIKQKYKDKFNDKEIVVYGFTKNISELMDISDVIISKPGGLTVSESIAKNIPMIIPYLIPGQEEENADFLVQSEVAIRTEKIEEITYTVDDLIENPDKLKKMKQNMKELSEPHSIESVVRLADELISHYKSTRKSYRENECDILILSAMFGLGHVTASNSIKEHIESLDGRLKVSIADIFEIISPQLQSSIYKGYEVLIKNMHEIYNYFYKQKTSKNNSQLDRLMYRLYLSKVAEYIQDVKPKMIVSTFPLCSGFISLFKEEYKSTIPLITCITDVSDSWEWIHSSTNRYLVATENLKDKLVIKGINSNIIKVTGIPVRKEFLDSPKNKEILNKLSISENDFVIMLMGGGIGLLPEDEEIYNWLDDLDGVKTIILTGKNLKAYKHFTEKLRCINIKVLGYTDEVADLMSISNLIITKAGGVTVFEAIVSEVPIIAFNPILGQEIENGKFIIESGIGEVVHNTKQLKERIKELIDNRNYQSELHRGINEVKNSIDTRNLGKYILELYTDIEAMEDVL